MPPFDATTLEYPVTIDPLDSTYNRKQMGDWEDDDQFKALLDQAKALDLSSIVQADRPL